MNKKELQEKINETEEILKHHNVEIKREDFEGLQHQIDIFNAKIVFVGGFSAGKTALVNSILGEELLKEDILPQTAIATEIVHNVDEKIRCVAKDGSETICNFSDVEQLSTMNFRKYVYMVNKNSLLDFQDKTIVDMPGFDSGLEAHNQAVLQYLSEAAAYIFVIDANKGTLGRSSIEFLKEIQKHSQSVYFVLTKCDKMCSADIDDVVENIQSAVMSSLGKVTEILRISSRAEDAGEKMIQLIQRIPSEQLLVQKLGEPVIILLQYGIKSLETQLTGMDFNPYELDRAIRECEREKKDFEGAFARKIANVKNESQNNKAILIMQDVKNALRTQVKSLAVNAEKGVDAFNEAINSILRRTLLEASQHHAEEMYDDLLQYLDEFAAKNPPINAEDFADKMQHTIGSLQTIMKVGQTFAKVQRYGKMYKFLSTGIALTTSVVLPWMELIIIFLPDIVSVLHKFFGQSQEEKLCREIENKVIPEICERLQPEINQSMKLLEESMIEELQEKYMHVIEDKTVVLAKLREEKTKKIERTEQDKASLRKSIEQLQENVRKIEAAMI